MRGFIDLEAPLAGHIFDIFDHFPASDVASNVHNMRGFQYTLQIGVLLLLYRSRTVLELLRSLFVNLFPKCSLTGFKNDI